MRQRLQPQLKYNDKNNSTYIALFFFNCMLLDGQMHHEINDNDVLYTENVKVC